ncbi:methyltransferase, FkbM family [Sphingomonas sp. OV641]|uniref:FkbM family methyltransferase n=1 Tax=Sphingomonas sp. OV641 TaxID=1881068 RepID=UPI0008C8EF0F|nr:FkbM family methyltransferase [Sphingomonas sp. OV641]SEI93506.1 methyltransferase, FkbM family [Sphingomonas sp. OV641]
MRFLDHQATPADIRRQGEAQGAIFDIWALRSGDRWRHEAVIRGLCQTAYLGDHTAICRVLGRYKMFVDTKDIGVASHLMLDGYWEMWNTEAIVGLIKPGMTAMDVGAHCGYFSLLLADLVGPEGKVLSFEPNPPIAELLRRSVAVNGFDGRTSVYEVALGDQGGSAILDVPRNEPKNAHVVQGVAGPGMVEVPLQRADRIAGASEADFIKIDAEGAEQAIWKGLEGILQQQRPLTILLEFAGVRYADPASFLDEILAYGFNLAEVDLVGGIQDRTRDQVLNASPVIDQMLLLERT